VWHWSTVDWGRRFVCLGYNTLHNVRTKRTEEHDDELDNSRDTPHGKRVWNWLLLCEEATVISISEDPFPFSEGRLQVDELRTLYTTRRNLVTVFRQLTKAPTAFRENSLIMLPIRHRIGNSEEETAHRPTDAPGLLFYYLFEDWFTTYSLVTRREHGYAAELDRLVGSRSLYSYSAPAVRQKCLFVDASPAYTVGQDAIRSTPSGVKPHHSVLLEMKLCGNTFANDTSDERCWLKPV